VFDGKMTNLSYPFSIDRNGRTGTVEEDRHIRQLIEQVLFTVPGERVNRPTFGTPINQLVFAPNSSEIATASQVLIQGSLQQWLDNIIRVESVEVDSEESTMRVTIQYVVTRTQQRRIETFSKEI
jgi:phage baseplate assembly protein W